MLTATALPRAHSPTWHDPRVRPELDPVDRLGGGGSADGGSPDATAAVKTAVPITTVKVAPTVPPTVFTPTTPSGPAAPLPVGNVITDVKIQNTAAAQTNVPFTFGQVFAVGALQPSEGLVSKLQDGTALRLQVDVKATHADGSVRHAVISGVLPALAAGQAQTLELAKSSAKEQSTVTPQSVVDAGLTGSISIKLDNVQYSASLATALSTANPVKWLSGPVANEWIVIAPLRDAAGNAHPHLTARFAVRSYPGLTKQARVEAGVENNKTFAAGARNFTYDVNVVVDGRNVYSQAALTHYHHARWHQFAWWDAGEPAVHIKHNTCLPDRIEGRLEL